MRKKINICFLVIAMLFLVACNQTQTVSSVVSENSSSNTVEISLPESAVSIPLQESDEKIQESNEENTMIRISDGTNTVVFELNGSTAAKQLQEQLPLSIEISNYSTNEKIFYPPNELDITDTPKASGETGTLAYFKSWENVVLFYGSISPNSSLYELGRAVEGEQLISSLQGTVTIETVTI